MKKLMVAVGAVLSVGAAFAASYNVSTYVELTNALVSVVQSGDEVVIAASTEPYVLSARLSVPAGVTVRGATGDWKDVVISGGGKVAGLSLGAGSAVSNLTVTSCVIGQNGSGGGIYANVGSIIENCRVTGCSGTASGVYGVGVYLKESTMKRCVIDGNGTTTGAGNCRGVALYTSGSPSNVLVEDTVITNNWMTYQQLHDGYYIGAPGVSGAGKFVRCYIANNRFCNITSTGSMGTGFYANGQVTILNCTIEGNTYGQTPYKTIYGLTVSGNQNSIMRNTVVLDNGWCAGGRLNNATVGTSCKEANFTQNASDGVNASTETYIGIAVTRDDFVRIGGMLRPKPNTLASGLGALPDWDGVAPVDPVHVPATNLVSDISLLQAAIDAAKPGDVVQIAKGTYTLTATISVKNGVIVEGATGNRDDVTLDAAGARCVASVTGATLRHVTLANGCNKSGCGGVSIGLEGVLENCRVTGVVFPSNGNGKIAGLVVNNNGGRVIGCLIDHNTAQRGCRSLAYDQSYGFIDRSVIRDNHITSCNLTDGDEADRAAFWLRTGSMHNCIVRDNAIDNVKAISITPGLGTLNGTGGEIVNCLICNNTYSGVESANEWGITVSSAANIINSVVLNNGHVNTLTKNFPGAERHKNNVTDEAAAALCTDSFTGTIEGLFLQTGNDLDIKAGSDLIDAGVARTDLEPGQDVYGRGRLAGERIDIGPFEYHVPPFAVTFESPIYSALDKLETTLTATATGDTEGTVYSWFLDDAEEPFSTGEDKQIVPLVITELGTHTVTLKAVNGAGLADEFVQSYKVQQGTFVVNPGESIAAAIAEAEPGATVLLKRGVHTNAAAIVVNKAIALRGESREETVITGTNKVGGVSLKAAGATLADLTVTDCYGSYFHADSGFAGVRLEVGTVMSNCVVRNCKANGTGPEGAGVCAVDGRIYDSVISNCTNGSACYVGGQSALMVRSFVCGNKSNGVTAGDGYTPLGTGVIIDGGEVRDSVITGNVAKDSNWTKTYAAASMSAAGVLLYSGKLVNCTVVGNTFEMKPGQFEVYHGLGGGVAAEGGTVVNCLVADNLTNDGALLDNALDRNGPSRYTTCCTSSIESFPEGNVSSVPGPVYRYSKRLGEYRLTQGSPCAGAGTWQTWMADAPDIYGRAWNPDRVDIGAAVYDCKGLLLLVK